MRAVLRAAKILLLCWCGVAGAQDAAAPDGRVLDELEIAPVGSGARVAARFNCPLRYASHFPSTAATEVRITLVPLARCPDGALETTLHPQAGNAAGLTEARLESTGAGYLLTLSFAATVDVAVHPAPDSQSIEVAVIGETSIAQHAPQVAAVAAGAVPAATRTLPAPEELERQWLEARAAFDAADYATAVRLLTRLTEYPEHLHRAEAQELLGLSRERNHQLAHAKAEYEGYLRQYPDGVAADRVRQRLAALTTLDRSPQAQTAAREAGGMEWTTWGGWSQNYYYDSTSLDAGQFSTDFVSQSMLATDGDFSIRGRGERFDVNARVNAGYMYDMLPDGPGNQTRVSYAYAELVDRKLGLAARLGRQSQRNGGVLGAFDGLHLGWRTGPGLQYNLTAGYALDTSLESPATDRPFAGVSVDWSGWVQGLSVSPYFISQRYDGLTDRQAVGTDLRWYAPGRTLVGLVDYDVDYGALNLVMALGTFELPGHWLLTGSLDHRKSPFLTTRNALSGQTVQSLSDLVALYGEEAVRALAEDRTADAETYTLGISRPFGTRLQWNLDVTSTSMSGMPASGGVPALPGMGTDLSIGTQLIVNSLFMTGDAVIAGLRVIDGSTVRTLSLALSSRFPLWNGLRIAPRLRFDQRTYDFDGSDQWLVSPSVRLDWLLRRTTTIELEAGGEFASRDRLDVQEDSTRYWFNLGYRVGF